MSTFLCLYQQLTASGIAAVNVEIVVLFGMDSDVISSWPATAYVGLQLGRSGVHTSHRCLVSSGMAGPCTWGVDKLGISYKYGYWIELVLPAVDVSAGCILYFYMYRNIYIFA